MNDSEFSPREQELINRLANAPQSDLSPDAFEAIRARMLEGLDTLPIENIPRRSGRTLMSTSVMAAVAAVLVVAIGITALLLNQPPVISPTPIITTPSTFTVVPSTATLPIEITVTHTTPIPIQMITPEVTPEISLTPTLESIIVVEGPVQAINANIITIYGIDITLNSDDPLLAVLVVGDVLHIEATYDTTATVIVAVTIEAVTNEVNVNPSTDEIWRDDGNCNNPPPPWAPANGWRRRCENPNSNSGNGNNGNGNGNGNNNGKGNDDDEDD